MAINGGNMGMNYQGYGRQMPFAGAGAMTPMQGGRQFGQYQNRGGHQNNVRAQQMPNGRNNFRSPNQPQAMMPGMQRQPGMNMMQGMQRQPGMNMMQGMQGQPGMNMMHGMQGQPGMNMMQGMQGQPGMNMMQGMQGQPGTNMMPQMQGQPGMPQAMDGVTFEPLDPMMRQMMPAMGAQSPEPVSAFSGATPSTSDSHNTLSSFIQGEKNAQIFYSDLYELAGDEHARHVISSVRGNADKRRQILSSMYDKMTGGAFPEKDLPIMNSRNFSHGVKMAIETENNTVSEMSDLYEKLDNGMHLKALNAVIQKKITDIISLQQLAIYN